MRQPSPDHQSEEDESDRSHGRAVGIDAGDHSASDRAVHAFIFLSLFLLIRKQRRCGRKDRGES